MTKQDFYEKYGSIKVKFSSYYKYTFTYVADLPDGKWLTCSYGGGILMKFTDTPLARTARKQ